MRRTSTLVLVTPRIMSLVLAVALTAGIGSCGTEQSSGPRCSPGLAVATGTTQRQIEFGGDERSYLLHVPPAYDGRTRLPVIMLFHGFGGDARDVLHSTRMDELADKENALIVAPQGSGIISSWDFGSDSDQPGTDVAFAHDLLDDVKEAACVDADRVFAAGFSNGSALALALACEDSSDFAAFAGVAAPFYAKRCQSAPPRSIIYFHGAADVVVPYSGSKTIIGRLPGVIEAMTTWAMHDECRRPAQTSTVSKHVELYRWTRCAGSHDISAYVVASGGHAWPGGIDLRTPAGRNGSDAEAVPRTGMTQEINATDLMWSFFSRHPRSRG